MDPIETLISENPHFNTDAAGGLTNWSVMPDVLRFIRRSVKPPMRTLETGAGQSTIAFAIAGSHHVSITYDRLEAERIRGYCRQYGIQNTITFIHESSDIALASGQGIPDVIDFLLIDGAHRFPFPILDWYFTESKVPVGGIVAIDDYHLPSVRMLHDFLMEEDEWEIIQCFRSGVRQLRGTSFFRRKREKFISLDDVGQPWRGDYAQNINKSRRHPLRYLLRHPRYTLAGIANQVHRILNPP